MSLQGTQLEILDAIADIQEMASTDTVDDMEIAEEVDLEVKIVHNTLRMLAEQGYVQLERIDRLSGVGYAVSLTPAGREILEGMID
jgi:DNA-binding MarR family transcriptional regulator